MTPPITTTTTRRRQRKEFRVRLGERLRRRREIAQLTQSQLARKLPGQMDGGQISRWERGESFPTYANLLALARALGITEEELLAEDVPVPQRRAG